MNEHDAERILRGLAAACEPPSFESGFSDRVLARLAASTSPDPSVVRLSAMRRVFVRLAPLALAASLVLAAYSLASEQSGSARTPLEAVLGLPEFSVEAVYAPVLTPGGD